MKAHIIVGATDTGKSYFIKKLLKKVPNKQALLIYDIEGEYEEFYPYRLEEFETFINKAVNYENAIIVLEETTAFLSNRGDNMTVRKLLVQKKHSKNYIILVFHSVRMIPRFIYELSNFITIFKTNDAPDMTAKELKDHRLEAIMTEVKNSKNPHYNKTLKIY
jgi:hypothetical protein